MNEHFRKKLWLLGAIFPVAGLLHFVGVLFPLLHSCLIVAGLGFLGVAGWRFYSANRNNSGQSLSFKSQDAVPFVAYGLLAQFFSGWFQTSLPKAVSGGQTEEQPGLTEEDTNIAKVEMQRAACLKYWNALRSSDEFLVNGFKSLKGNDPTMENFNALRTLFIDSASKLQSASPNNVHAALLEAGGAQLRALNSFIEYCDRGITHESEVAEVKERANSWKFLVDSAASGFSGAFGGDAFKPVRDVQNQADALAMEAQAMQEQRLEALAEFNRVVELRSTARNLVARDLNFSLPPY